MTAADSQCETASWSLSWTCPGSGKVIGPGSSHAAATFSWTCPEFCEAIVLGSSHATVIFSWTSHAAIVPFSSTCLECGEVTATGSSPCETLIFSSTSPEFGKAIVPGSSHAAVTFSSICPKSGKVIVPGSSHTSGGSCAARDDLPVTESE
jgi:hypothetical protein